MIRYHQSTKGVAILIDFVTFFCLHMVRDEVYWNNFEVASIFKRNMERFNSTKIEMSQVYEASPLHRAMPSCIKEEQKESLKVAMVIRNVQVYTQKKGVTASNVLVVEICLHSSQRLHATSILDNDLPISNLLKKTGCGI